jgi:hypothetical protein
MAIIWLRSDKSSTSKRAAQREQTRLRKSGYNTSIVDKQVGKVKIYGVKYG